MVSVGTRVFHQTLGEGMINKVKKDEYEVVYMNGSRGVYRKDSTELTILSNLINVKPRLVTQIPKPVVEKTVNIPIPGFEAEDVSMKTPVKEEKVVEAVTQMSNMSASTIVTVGSRVDHKDFGEGMINKIADTYYEVMTMEGKIIKVMKDDPNLTTLTNIKQANVEKKVEKKETSNFKMSFKQKLKTIETSLTTPDVPVVAAKEEPFVEMPVVAEEKKDLEAGMRVNHLILGEGMINKVTDKFYEVVFLDGKKSRFLKTDANLSTHFEEKKETVKPIETIIPLTDKKDKSIAADAPIERILDGELPVQEEKSAKNIPLYVSTGSRIYHKVKGEGMIGKIKDNEYEIIFMDGSKASYNYEDPNLSLILNEEKPELSQPIATTETKVENIKPVASSAVNLSLGSKWKGGTLILKPANSSLQKKEYTIESFFQIILSIRNRMESLESFINNNKTISPTEKQEVQMQIKSINRSLVAFNMLFKEKEDYFNE